LDDFTGRTRAKTTFRLKRLAIRKSDFQFLVFGVLEPETTQIFSGFFLLLALAGEASSFHK
jgi:hypothetical protein